MFQLPTFEELNMGVALPAMFLTFAACVLLLIDLAVPKGRKVITAWITVGILAVSMVLNLAVYTNSGEAFLGTYIGDQFTAFLNIVILFTTFISVLLSIDYVRRTGLERGEYYLLILLSTSGMMFMAGANDLVMIFVALEMLSIPLYILAAFRRPDLKSEESGIKYFVLGAFASAFLVYGSALIFGATGTTNLPQIFAAVEGVSAAQGTQSFLLVMGGGLVLVGLGFKVAVVPFHMWTPDVYEGAPSPITAFMSVGAKAGGFAALLRVLAIGLPLLTVGTQTAAVWQQAVWLIAAATLILGNLVAISQSNIKRMLAYSSIAHAGYIMMAVAAAGTAGMADAALRAAAMYLMGYTFTNLGAFAVAIALEKDDGSGTNLEDFVGLGRSRPMLAFMMTVFMLSLIGIPLTGGFIGKWFVFQATLEAGLIPLAVIGVLTSVISAFYYMRIVINMYLREGSGDEAVGATNNVTLALYAAFAGTVLMGLFPFLVTNLSEGITVAATFLGR